MKREHETPPQSCHTLHPVVQKPVNRSAVLLPSSILCTFVVLPDAGRRRRRRRLLSPRSTLCPFLSRYDSMSRVEQPCPLHQSYLRPWCITTLRINTILTMRLLSPPPRPVSPTLLSPLSITIVRTWQTTRGH